MTIETISLQDDGEVPNTDRFPLLLYRGAFRAPVDPSGVEKHLSANRWFNSWRDGVFSYHHYHATVHEVLVCYRGRATVQCGGASGPEVALSEGDAVLIPAGVGHKRLSAGDRFAVIGAYLDGAYWDLRRPETADIDEARNLVSQCSRPPVDPIVGKAGGLLETWPET